MMFAHIKRMVLILVAISNFVSHVLFVSHPRNLHTHLH